LKTITRSGNVTGLSRRDRKLSTESKHQGGTKTQKNAKWKMKRQAYKGAKKGGWGRGDLGRTNKKETEG